MLIEKVTYLKKVGAVFIIYIIGLIIGNFGLLPENSEKILENISSVSILLALPLLLFSVNIKTWFKLAGKTFLSLLIGIVSVTIVVVVGYFIFKDKINDSWKVAGMLMGVYSGGTPNLAAIQKALSVSYSDYILVHSFDMLFSASYLLFLISIGYKLIRKILPAFKTNYNKNNISINEFDNYSGIINKENIFPLLKVLGIAILALVIGAGLYIILPENISMAVVILLVTSIGILFSLIPSVSKTKHSFDLGMYFILVFSLTVASMADIQKIFQNFSDLALYIGIAVFGSLLLHLFLSKLFKIDADTTIITSTALICSPPFVPIIASALRNREVIISGISVGIIGFAIGNYFGVFLAYLLY